MFSVKGTIKLINDEQVISDKFKKREFVLTEDSSQYPQHVMFQVVQDKTAMLNDVQVGETVNVFFNLRGREWTSPQGEIKYFNTLDCWKIEKVGSSIPGGEIPAAANLDSAEEDDLPF